MTMLQEYVDVYLAIYEKKTFPIHATFIFMPHF